MYIIIFVHQQLPSSRQITISARGSGEVAVTVSDWRKSNKSKLKHENVPIHQTLKNGVSSRLQVVTEYYAKPKERRGACNNFELDLTFERDDQGQIFMSSSFRGRHDHKYNIFQMWKKTMICWSLHVSFDGLCQNVLQKEKCIVILFTFAYN